MVETARMDPMRFGWKITPRKFNDLITVLLPSEKASRCLREKEGLSPSRIATIEIETSTIKW